MNAITVAALGLALVMTGCTGTSEETAEPAEGRKAATPSGTASATASETTARCPDVQGGLCQGPLRAGAYETSVFQPHLRYAVPDDTWASMEDLPGNFLLYRPQDSQEGVEGGSYLSVYQNVRAPDTDCAEKWEEGVGHTPQDLIEFYQAVPGLKVSRPREVSVGGLNGYQVDFTVTRDDALCDYDGYAGTPLIIGSGVSDLHHITLPQLDVRLLLLAWQGGNVAIEITNVRSQYPASKWRDLTQSIVDSFEFS